MNNFDNFMDWIKTGNEIEFTYKGKQYSVTYSTTTSNQEEISFCEFYKEPVNFKTAEEFMNNAKIDGELLKDIWEKVVDIFIF